MSRGLSTWVEKFLWNNLKMYLMEYDTCLCDALLKVKDANSNLPINRYEDFLNQLEAHIGLGSYVTQQATQFSTLPYITVRIAPYDVGHCASRAIVSFDVVFATDVPHGTDDKNPGNSSEAVATFRARIMDSLDKLMYEAYDREEVYDSPAFFDRLRDQTLADPLNPERTLPWKFNVVGTVSDEKDITEVIQLKREDRSSGLSVFTVTYYLDISKLYGDGVDCGC